MWGIYKKEMLELLRDKKTLIFVVLLPVLLMPVLFTGVALMAKHQVEKEESRVLKYAVYGDVYFNEFANALSEDKSLSKVEGVRFEDVEKAIREERIDFAINIPETFQQTLAQAKQVEIEIHYNDASQVSRVFSRVNSHFSPLVESTRDTRLQAAGFSNEQIEAVIEPMTLKKISIANMREGIGESIGAFVGYFLMIICFSGAMAPAIDVGVGEKERGTLETLLLTPLARSQIVMAKTGVIFTTGIFSVFLSLFSGILWVVLVGQTMATGKILELISIFSVIDIILIFMMLVPIGLIFSSLLLSISIYAKNVKEAQSYISPLMIVILMAVVVAVLPGMELDWLWAMVPFTNVSLVMKEIFKGTIDPMMLSVVFFSMFAVAGVLTWLSTHWFKRETVLFRF